MSLPIHFTNILCVSEWSERESKQNYQNQHKNKRKCTNKHVLSKYKHRQDFRRSIPVAVDNGMWELSWPPSALRHTLLLLRMAPTQTGLCPLPAVSSSFPHHEHVFSAVVWTGIRRGYVLGRDGYWHKFHHLIWFWFTSFRFWFIWF